MSENIPFQLIDWSSVPTERHEGQEGFALWQTIQFKGLRIRLVDYSPGYMADHWCTMGHFIFCLKGSFVSELNNGEQFSLSENMSYIVSDELSSHRSFTKAGVKLLIMDGDFLKHTP
jgi:hypothetical protein